MTSSYVHVSIALAALSVSLLVGALTLFCGSFAKAMRKLRGLYALFVLVIVLGMLAVGGVLIRYGLAGPDQTPLYLGIGALVAAAGLFDLGTRHLKTWEGLLGAPDSFKRWHRLMGEIRLLWEEEPQAEREASLAAGPSEPPAPSDVAGEGRTFSFSRPRRRTGSRRLRRRAGADGGGAVDRCGLGFPDGAFSSSSARARRHSGSSSW